MALLSFVESAPRAYRLKASNAASPISTSSGTIPIEGAEDIMHPNEDLSCRVNRSRKEKRTKAVAKMGHAATRCQRRDRPRRRSSRNRCHGTHSPGGGLNNSVYDPKI